MLCILYLNTNNNNNNNNNNDNNTSTIVMVSQFFLVVPKLHYFILVCQFQKDGNNYSINKNLFAGKIMFE